MDEIFSSENKNMLFDNIEGILSAHPDVLAPVKEILNILKKQKEYENLTYDELVNLLKSDDRFEFVLIPERIETDEDSPLIAQNIEKVEDLGFYSGSRVKLKNAKLDVDKIVDILNRKVDMMMEVLVNIWDKRPLDEPSIEDNLLDILARAQKLQREVKNVTNPEKLKPFTDYLRSKDKKDTDET
jgi:hypothetical protein